MARPWALHTALRGIAGLKFTDEEVAAIVDLITSRPVPRTPSGSNFLSLGLCMLVACSSLTTASSQLEKRVTDWVKWLVNEEALASSSDQVSSSGSGGQRGSFAEMLLLMAIHFHSNQVWLLTHSLLFVKKYSIT